MLVHISNVDYIINIYRNKDNIVTLNLFIAIAVPFFINKKARILYKLCNDCIDIKFKNKNLYECIVPL